MFRQSLTHLKVETILKILGKLNPVGNTIESHNTISEHYETYSDVCLVVFCCSIHACRVECVIHL